MLTLCISTLGGIGWCQANGILCRNGAGQFRAKFVTGVIVSVGAQKDSAFASRTCEASLIGSRRVVAVVRDAQQVDVDVVGADLGLGGASGCASSEEVRFRRRHEL